MFHMHETLEQMNLSTPTDRMGTKQISSSVGVELEWMYFKGLWRNLQIARISLRLYLREWLEDYAFAKCARYLIKTFIFAWGFWCDRIGFRKPASGKMGWSIKCLPCKYEDPNLIFKTYIQMKLCNLSSMEVEDYLEINNQTALHTRWALGQYTCMYTYLHMHAPLHTNEVKWPPSGYIYTYSFVLTLGLNLVHSAATFWSSSGLCPHYCWEPKSWEVLVMFEWPCTSCLARF